MPALRLSFLPPSLRIPAIVAGVVLVLLLALATMPIGWLRGPAQRAASAWAGRTVEIGAVERIDHFSLAPRLRLRDLRVAQPAWVAGGGDMLRVRSAEMRLPLLPLLRGAARPRDVMLDGVRLALVHDSGTRANWESGQEGEHSSGRRLGPVIVRDARASLDDARRRLRLAGTLAADARGVRIDLSGTHRGRPARFALRAGPVADTGPWPFRAAFASPLAQLRLEAVAERPLGLSRFDGTGSASGVDLAVVDDLIQAGLPGTQPVRLAGKVRHDGAAWQLSAIRGTIGASDVAGRISVDKRAGRSVIDGRLSSRRFGFDDLAPDAGLAQAAARRAVTGPRVIPETKIDLRKLSRTDGRLTVEIAALRSRERTVLRALSTTLTLDHSRLTAAPLSIALTHGRLEGRATVDQRDGAPPRLAMDLRLVGARLEDFIAGDRVTGPLHGRIALHGRGTTIRAALARADGQVTLAARGGSVERSAAELLGRNAGAALGALLGTGQARTPLRCLGLVMPAQGGVLRPSLLALDTGVMQAQGRGAIRLGDERIALTLDGRSKNPGLVRLSAPIRITGTLSAPQVETADAGLASARTILSTLGNAVKRLFEGREPPAPDIDCGALMARVG